MQISVQLMADIQRQGRAMMRPEGITRSSLFLSHAREDGVDHPVSCATTPAFATDRGPRGNNRRSSLSWYPALTIDCQKVPGPIFSGRRKFPPGRNSGGLRDGLDGGGGDLRPVRPENSGQRARGYGWARPFRGLGGHLPRRQQQKGS
jgi:hypothetical protein